MLTRPSDQANEDKGLGKYVVVDHGKSQRWGGRREGQRRAWSRESCEGDRPDDCRTRAAVAADAGGADEGNPQAAADEQEAERS